MKPVLKWQYEKIVKELLLLQDHSADQSCPCETENEKCVRKHLMTIEAYAEETMAIEENPEFREKLKVLSREAKEYRLEEERALCEEGESPSLLDWTRRWRKEFENYCLACENLNTP
jgi:hypothetical protein